MRYVDPDGRSDYLNNLKALHSGELKILLWDLKFFYLLDFKNNAEVATKKTVEEFSKNGWGDISDAFRHAYWSALNAKTAGVQFAEKYGLAHETDPLPGEKADLYMDIHNNYVGLKIIQEHPDITNQQLSALIKQKIDNGELLILDRNNGKLYWSNDINHENPVDFSDEKILGKNEAVKIWESVYEN